MFLLHHAFESNPDANFALLRFATLVFEFNPTELLHRGVFRVAARALALFPRCPVLQPMACKFFITAFEQTKEPSARRALVTAMREEGVIAQFQRAAKSGVTRQPQGDMAVNALQMLGERVCTINCNCVAASLLL